MSKQEIDNAKELTEALRVLFTDKKYEEASLLLEKNVYAVTSLEDAEYIATIFLGAKKFEKARDTLTNYSQSVGDETLGWKSWLIFGEIFHANFEPSKALACVEKGLLLAPQNRGLLRLKAVIFKSENRFSDSYGILKELINNSYQSNKLDHEMGILLSLCAEACKRLGRYKEGEEYLKRAIDISKTGATKDNQAELQLALAIHAEGGETSQSLEMLEKLINNNPKDYKAIFNYTRIKTFEEKDNFYDTLLAHLGDRDLPKKAQVQLGYSAAKICEDVNDLEGAMKYWEAAGEHLVERNRFDIINEKQKFAHIYKLFSESIPRLSLKDIEHENQKKPVFIVGMPRSGTTLLESIIGAHSEVYPAGELENLGMLFMPNKMMMLKEISRENLFEIRKLYHLYNTHRHLPKYIFTDKMPHNFRWIGFIIAAFPDAKVVHINRDPVAVCFSNFKRYFPAAGLAYSATQVNTAIFYKLYQDLMDFWKLRFPSDYYEISYERLTENTEQEIKSLLAFLELPFEKRCLEYHKKKRTVLTASQAQVNKGIYKGSSKSWQKYEKLLSPMLEQLRSDQII